MQSEVVYSLNHDLTASIVFNHTLNFQKKSTSTYTDIRIKVHPYPHSQHIKFLKHNIYVSHRMGTISFCVMGLPICEFYQSLPVCVRGLRICVRR